MRPYIPFQIQPIGTFKCENFHFHQTYYLIPLASNKWDDCHYVIDTTTKINKGPIMNWRIHKKGDFIKLYWPSKGTPEFIQNGTHVRIIFIKYRGIFRCLIRLMMIKKRAQMRIKARKNLRIAHLFRGVGNENLNTQILTFV